MSSPGLNDLLHVVEYLYKIDFNIFPAYHRESGVDRLKVMLS